MQNIADADLFAKLHALIKKGKFPIPDQQGYGGTGAPGKLLEALLGFDAKNSDGPDTGKWEIKFHSGQSLLTLFHKTPEPDKVMHALVNTCGWPDSKGRTSFRHTITGQSEKGFKVMKHDNKVIVINENYPDLPQPFWTHNTLLNAFAYKLRRLIVVNGTRNKVNNSLTFKRFDLYWEPKITSFINAIENGTVAVDFDARTNIKGAGLRDHGTKFRILQKDLEKLYAKSKKFF